MALNPTQLQTSLKALSADLLAQAEAGTPRPTGYFEDQLALIIDAYIKTATVTTTVAVTSVSGVTTGGGVSGPGAGTGAGSLS